VSAETARVMARINTDALKRDYPVEEIVERYGIDLDPTGRSLVGRCPFHDDGGRPNLYVYPSTESWYCYRCSLGGDVISFVERFERVGFADAVTRISSDRMKTSKAMAHQIRRVKSRIRHAPQWGPDERACLSAAVDLYHNRLLTDRAALGYVHGRGLGDDVIEHCHLGFAGGDELAAYLRSRRLPVQAAVRVGLLRRDGREFMTGRVVVPEIRGGQPIWLIGRTIEREDNGPKYLGLPGRKPLLGWELAKDSPEVFVVEGVFDWLTLLSWGYSALALVGTRARLEVLNALAGFDRIYVVLDTDQAGLVAAEDLVQRIGRRTVLVTLQGVKDVAELAMLPDGPSRFGWSLRQAEVSHAA